MFRLQYVFSIPESELFKLFLEKALKVYPKVYMLSQLIFYI
jgi:hypothetical protein